MKIGIAFGQMKVWIALCLCGLSIPLAAQTDLKTFTSPDGSFQFKYSPVLVHCKLEEPREGSLGDWVPADSCSSQGGLCDDVGSSDATTLVCLGYPRNRFKDKPTFSGAAFFLAELPAVTTRRTCLKGSENWVIESVRNVRIDSRPARLFRVDDTWTSHRETGEIYRIFHAGKCYELGIRQVSTSLGTYDPGAIKPFTRRDLAEVRRNLRYGLDSFRFLK